MQNFRVDIRMNVDLVVSKKKKQQNFGHIFEKFIDKLQSYKNAQLCSIKLTH